MGASRRSIRIQESHGNVGRLESQNAKSNHLGAAEAAPKVQQILARVFPVSEGEAQGHLNQARAPDGALNDARAKGSSLIPKCRWRGWHSRNRAVPLASIHRAGLKVRAEAGV